MFPLIYHVSFKLSKNNGLASKNKRKLHNKKIALGSKRLIFLKDIVLKFLHWLLVFPHINFLMVIRKIMI